MILIEYFNNLVEEKERLSNENAMLKRALDKACEVLSDCAMMQCGKCPKYKEQGEYLCDICYYETLNKDQWKKWCMKK